jgi:hypothetical protein
MVHSSLEKHFGEAYSRGAAEARKWVATSEQERKALRAGKKKLAVWRGRGNLQE